jgi:hypothetical protein
MSKYTFLKPTNELYHNVLYNMFLKTQFKKLVLNGLQK